MPKPKECRFGSTADKDHDVVEISRKSEEVDMLACDSEVVRWCQNCGTLFVDEEEADAKNGAELTERDMRIPKMLMAEPEKSSRK